MLLLTSTGDLLQIVTGSAVAVDVHASWVDDASGTVTPGRTNTAIVAAATTTVVGSPAASTQRNVKTLSVRNKSAATSQDVTVRHSDGTTIVELIKVTLLAGYELFYDDGKGFQVLDASGNALTTAAKARLTAFYDAHDDFGFVGDLVTVFDGAATAATTKITSATAGFTTNAVVGQRITLAGAGAAGAMYVGTILAIDSATQVDVSPAISTTVSAKGLSFGTDNTAAITAMVNAINGAAFPGATVTFGRSPTNAYGFPIQVAFTKPVQIQGIGGGHTADTGDYTRIGGTRLAWWGASLDGGTAFKPFIEVSPAGVQALKRVAFRHCWLDCRNGDQNEALIGLKLASCHGFMLDDFFIMDAAAIGLWTNIDADPTEAKDTTRFLIDQFCARMLDNPAGAVTTPFAMSTITVLSTTPQSLTVAANTLPLAGYMWTATNLGYPVLVRYTGGGGTTTLTGCTVSAEDAINAPATRAGGNCVQAVPGNGAAMVFDGSTTANTCCGLVLMMQLSHGTTWGPAALELRNSDSIEFVQPMINGGNATNDGAVNRIRKPGVRLNGSNTSATLAARNNSFRSGSAGAGGVSSMGALDTGARMLASAGPNYWDLYQLGNGEPIPVVEANGFFNWTPNGGFMEGQYGPASVADQAVPAATLTLITGSLLPVPPQGWQVGTKFRWKLRCSKTAAGVAARNWFIRAGTLGTTADAAIATFLSGLPTAAADNADIEIELTVRTLGAAATAVAHLSLRHDGFTSPAGTGFSVKPGVEINIGTMAAFNTTTATFIHLSLTTGASEAITIQSCGVEIVNAANP